MTRNSAIGYAAIVVLASAGIAACRTGELSKASTRGAPTALTPSSMARVGMIDQRFQSYNVKMLEVTGGKFAPNKPFWNTETADAACGGNPWAGTFLDTFRYLDQLGRLAKQDVKVVAHNTLVASDYGLLDDSTLEPKPMYWGALLWRRLMGTTVLESGIPVQQGLHVYAHCLRGAPGGVALLVINNDKDSPRTLALPVPSQRYTLAAPAGLQGRRIQLNGNELKLGDGDTLPDLVNTAAPPGDHAFAPATITFLAFPGAQNNTCR